MNGLDFGKLLIIIGIGCILLGGFTLLLSKLTGFGHLPGDISIERAHGSFYFPIVSCILISILLSVFANLFK